MDEQDVLERRKAALVAYLDEQAQWRSFKAEQYPEDERNRRSTAALSSLAEVVRTLPAAGLPLRRLLRITELFPGDDEFAPGLHIARAIRRWGFPDHGTKTMTPVEFLTHLGALALDDAEEARRQAEEVD